jgi:hypothetical protein
MLIFRDRLEFEHVETDWNTSWRHTLTSLVPNRVAGKGGSPTGQRDRARGGLSRRYGVTQDSSGSREADRYTFQPFAPHSRHQDRPLRIIVQIGDGSRNVAIKVLPKSVATDDNRLAPL